MAKVNCSACDELREDAPNFVVNGLGNTECASLKNNTGLNPSSGNNDCTDLENMNDCLIGNMESEIELYDVCDWKDYMRKFVQNAWTMFKGFNCAMCGIWANIHNICNQLKRASFIGSLTLYTTTELVGDGTKIQQLPFNANFRYGNIDESILTIFPNYAGVFVNNITSVPLLVDCIATCSIRTQQNFACCYLVVTRDGTTIGQTPFITPNTYDQQTRGEPFMLNPGETAMLSYYFGVGDKNEWFQNNFGYIKDGSGEPLLCLDADDPSNPENQRSYFSVKVTSVIPEFSC